MGLSLWENVSWVDGRGAAEGTGTWLLPPLLPPEAIATLLVFMVFFVTVQFFRGASSRRTRGWIGLVGVVMAWSFLDTFLSTSRGLVGFEVMVSVLFLFVVVMLFLYLRDENAWDYLGTGLEVKDGIRNRNVGE